jgi:hypothetical protein
VKKIPTCLSAAFQQCLDHALSKHRMSVDRVAAAMGLANPWSLYKWVAAGSMPMNLVRPFESACRCFAVTQFLAHSTGDHVLIKVPTGRRAGPSDSAALQAACADAVQAVVQFWRGGNANDPNGAMSKLDTAQVLLAHERQQIQKAVQPEFDFNEH